MTSRLQTRRNFLLHGERLRSALQFDLPGCASGSLILGGTALSLNVNPREVPVWDARGPDPYVGIASAEGNFCAITSNNHAQVQRAFELAALVTNDSVPAPRPMFVTLTGK